MNMNNKIDLDSSSDFSSDFDSSKSKKKKSNNSAKSSKIQAKRRTIINISDQDFSSDSSDIEQVTNDQEVNNSDENREQDDSSSPPKGTLVYIFRGDNDDCENTVISKICQKYGLDCWDNMITCMPWRNRANLRTTLCRMLRKQALSEYEGVRADPILIGEENQKECEGNPEYTVKSGIFVNLKWDRTPDEWKDIRLQNQRRFNIPDDVAAKIEIPTILSTQYMLQAITSRKQTLLLKRAAIRFEKLKRQAQKLGVSLKKFGPLHLGVNELSIAPANILELPEFQNKLKFSNKSQYYVDLSD